MGITNNNIPMVDIPRWEPTETMVYWTSYQAPVMCSSYHVKQQVLIAAGDSDGNSAVVYLYEPDVDGLIGIFPTTGRPSWGTYQAAIAHVWSTGTTVGGSSLTATTGTTSTITTNQTLAKNLKGWPIHIMSGPNAGQTLTITSNTVGTNSVITVPTQATAFDSTTTYRLMTPRWYFYTTTGPGFRAYDYATNSWVSLNANGPGYGSNTIVLAATPSWRDNDYLEFATGTATSATSTTLVNSAKSWTVNQWVNYQIRIVSGTGAGQIRTITANDATSVTVAAWTTTPDSTSTYSIEGNDDFIYYTGNGSNILYRYSISANTWTTLSPTVARSGSNGGGTTLFWPCEVDDSQWTNENSIINGRRLYSHRGGAASSIQNVDYYDIPSNSWSTWSYSPLAAAPGIGGGARWVFIKDKVYWTETTYNPTVYRVARWNALDIVRQELLGFPPFPRWASTSSNAQGNYAFDAYYKNGNDYVRYVYSIVSNTPSLVNYTFIRCMLPKGY